MTDETNGFCRLCAEPRRMFDMISPERDIVANSKLITKLSWIQIDVTSRNGLPGTICYACLDLLEGAWSFLNAVRSAQEKLAALFLRTPRDNVHENKNVQKVLDKPANMNCETLNKLKYEVKVEKLREKPSNLLLNDNDVKFKNKQLEIKIETNQQEDNIDCIDSNDELNSDSDVPIKQSVFKKRGRPSLKESIERKTLLQNITWDNQICVCAKCNLKCQSILELQQHSIQIHNSCCIIKCAKCSKILPGWRTFIRHSRTHNKYLKHCCEFCNKLFIKLKEINSHKNESHKYIYRSRCINCGIQFDKPEKLQEHKNLFSKNFKLKIINGEENELKCDICSKIFKSRITLQQHKQVHSERAKDFACHICGRTFYKKGTLSTHLLIHQEISERQFKCSQCPLAFRTKGNLTSHISLHTGLKPFVCEQCGQSFRIKRHLISHSIVHTDLRPYNCTYCNRFFRFKISLNQHLRQQICLHPKKLVETKSKKKKITKTTNNRLHVVINQHVQEYNS